MKRTIMVVCLAILLAAFPAMAQQMMDEGQQQQQSAPQQYYPNQMYPGMMGGYGGYGMGPGMMGGYGGYGRGPGMMGNYGYGVCPQCGRMGGPNFNSNEEYTNFLNQTKEQRKKLNNLMFEYNEEINSPNPDREKLAKMEKEIDELRSEIFNYKTK